MPSVTFRLAPTLHERFLAYCEAKDTKPSEILREAIERFIDHKDDESLGHHGPRPRDRLPAVITGRQLQERMTMDDVRPRPAPGSRLKVKK